MTPPTLVVLAAGIGSRYGGLKQLDPVGPGCELIIHYSIYDALRAGFDKVLFVIRQEMEEAFRDRIGRQIESRCETAYAYQCLDDLPPGFHVPPGRAKPWGTGHAVLACRGQVDAPFAVINADDFYGRSAYEALGRHLAREGASATNWWMVGYRLEDTLSEFGHVARGVCAVDDDGYLVEVQERTHVEKYGTAARYAEDGLAWVEVPADTPVSMNIWGFTPALFAELEDHFLRFLIEKRHHAPASEFLLPRVVGDLVREGQARVKVLPARDGWFGVTYREDRPRVEAAIADLIRRGVYPPKLWDEGA
jgi:NDP-sugar pyrophosphorylase family protein